MATADDGVRCMVLRGGSSKGAYFTADALPADAAARDDLLLRILGSPDPRQIDGIGGANPLTSKVAVVHPSPEPDVDIEYLFLQVPVDNGQVSDRQNCGNLLAGVGPFAIERDLMERDLPTDGVVHVRIRMRNTDTVATARFAVADGRPVYTGSTAVSGVPGTAAPIELDFEDLAGSSCGALFPTGHRVDVVGGVPCTLIDNGMPVVVMSAADLGVRGDESCAELEADQRLRATIEVIRREAGPMMGLGDVADTTVPKLTIVSPPRAGGDLCTRTFVPHRCHDAIGVLGAVSVATAARIENTVAHDAVAHDTVPGAEQTAVDGVAGTSGRFRLEHPTGHFDASVEVDEHPDTGDVTVGRAGIVRTARKLMDGTVFPRPESG